MGDLLKKKKQPTVLGVNLVYLCVLLLMVVAQLLLTNFLPQASQGAGEYWKLFFLELLLIGGPPLVYMIFSKMDIGEVARFNRLRPTEIILVIGMAIFGFFVTIIINLLWYWVASHWGSPAGQELPAIENGLQFLVAVLVIGLVPALVEEFLFRGLILRGYEKFGSKIAIVVTGILFGMLHLQLMSIPSIILIGVVMSYVVYRTNSILAGIIYHFLHNTIAVAILYMQNVLMKTQGAVEGLPQDLSQLPDDMLMVVFVVWGIIGFLALILFVSCIVVFHKYTQGRGHIRERSEKELGRSNFFEMLPALIALAIVVINLIYELLYMTGFISI